MSIKTKKIQKALIVCGSILAIQSAYAQEIPFPEVPYTASVMQSNNCDPNVYQQMYDRQKMEYNAKYASLEKVLIKSQLEAQPKTATTAAMKCVDGALNQIKGIANTIDSLLGMITGSGNIDWAALGASALNRLGDMACNQINNYTNGMMYSATSPYTSTINQGVGMVNGAGVNTPVGNLNVGNSVWNAAQKGTQSGTGPVSGAVNGTVNTVGGAVNAATGVLK